MKVHTFPQCCGAGVLILEHLTGKGKKADFDLIKKWIAYAKRNGYRMYDFPEEYEGTHGDPMTSKAKLGSPTDKQSWVRRNSWGMLLAIACPGQEEIGERLVEFGFKELLQTWNPVYSDKHHKITLYGLDITGFTQKDLEEDGEPAVKAKAKAALVIEHSDEDYDDSE